jgi:N,N'-diacetyllegionaminate synthase
MKIGSVDLSQEVMIVAEIGNNHEGSFALAEEMIGRAAESGVHAVKFQTYVPEQYVSNRDADRLARLRRFALTTAQFRSLAELAKKLGVLFFSTPFDLDSAEALNGFSPVFKIASGDNTFLPLIEKVATFKKPIMLSCGLADLSEITTATDAINEIWRRESYLGEVALLHCVSSYPTSPAEANLGAIKTLFKRFGGTIGYSDHTLGIEASIFSVALGARIIEKHFTTDKQYSDFRDHQISADPSEMRELVEKVKLAQVLVGDGLKNAQPSEEANRVMLRRSIAAKYPLDKGTVLRWEHLSWVRPGSGLPPGAEDQLIGRRLKAAVSVGELLNLDHVD